MDVVDGKDPRVPRSGEFTNGAAGGGGLRGRGSHLASPRRRRAHGTRRGRGAAPTLHHAERSEEHTSELQSQSNLVCRLLLEKKNRGTRSFRGSGEITTPAACTEQLRASPSTRNA